MMKTNDSNNSRPFYLKAPKSAMKPLLFTGLILLAVGLSAPVLLLFSPIYLVYAFYKIKSFRSVQSRLLSSAIFHYLSNELEECSIDIRAYIELEPKNVKGRIISALLEYQKENYDKFVSLMEEVPKSIINNDLDLQLKLGESYENTAQWEKAEIVYKRLQWIFPKSEFVKDAMERVKTNKA